MAKKKAYSHPPSKGGYNYYELISALQKFIRRGMEHEAMFVATELYISGWAEDCWTRLRIIASEDVGLAEPNVAMNIAALYSTYTAFKKKANKRGPERLHFVHAVLMLVRAKKSRYVDNQLCEYFDLRHRVKRLNLQSYDFVYDCHTWQGRQKGRGNDHFYDESAKIENANLELVPEEFEYRDKLKKMYQVEDGKAPNGDTELDNGVQNTFQFRDH